MRALRTIAAGLAALAMLVTTAPVASADDRFPARIDLPDGFFPEGITTGRGTTVFTASLFDGAIWRGDVRSGSGSVLVPGAAGRVAVGVDFDRRTGTLWVAGGPTRTVTAYDAETGAQVASYSVDAGFLNDVAVTRDAVYVTDSFVPQLIVVPLGDDGTPAAAARTLALSGDFVPVGPFDANGIVGLRGGRSLLVVQSSTGLLFRVDPETGVATTVDLGGATLTGGDGLERRGHTLWVVRGDPGQVERVRLRDHGLSGELVGTLDDPDLDVPTTVTFAAGRLWVANARFTTPRTPDTDYWITRLPRR